MALLIPPPLVAILHGLIIWAISKFIPIAAFDFPGRFEAAIGFAIAGLTLDLVSVFLFLKSKTTVTPINPAKASTLVTSGFYRFTRNPMYLGMALILAGWGIYCGNVLGFMLIASFVWYITQFQIKPEEAKLQLNFGEAFDAYCKRVRRWI